MLTSNLSLLPQVPLASHLLSLIYPVRSSCTTVLECMRLLNVPTVWKELEKENKEFFEAYEKRREEKAVQEGDKSTGSKT